MRNWYWKSAVKCINDHCDSHWPMGCVCVPFHYCGIHFDALISYAKNTYSLEWRSKFVFLVFAIVDIGTRFFCGCRDFSSVALSPKKYSWTVDLLHKNPSIFMWNLGRFSWFWWRFVLQCVEESIVQTDQRTYRTQLFSKKWKVGSWFSLLLCRICARCKTLCLGTISKNGGETPWKSRTDFSFHRKKSSVFGKCVHIWQKNGHSKAKIMPTTNQLSIFMSKLTGKKNPVPIMLSMRKTHKALRAPLHHRICVCVNWFLFFFLFMK